MPSITIVMSDLHLADGHEILDCFNEKQQAAFNGLLHAACSVGPLSQAETVELIINGDCFDFMVTQPYDARGTITAATALEKLEKIIAAHLPFFEALQRFLAAAGRHVAFLTGNHDLELRFAEVRSRIFQQLHMEAGPRASKVKFIASRFYRPLPDVYIEHGNHYDVWNHAIDGLWGETGQPLTLNPTSITLSPGTRYFQHSAYPISLRYPYFDHFEPFMNPTRQIALLCLLDPELIVETAQRTMELLSEPRTALANLAPGAERVPSNLFEQVMQDFAAFEQDMLAHKIGWTESGELNELDKEQAQARVISEYMQVREALVNVQPGATHNASTSEAIAAICTPVPYAMEEAVTAGMRAVLKRDSRLRYALAGHTHMLRIDKVSGGLQSYLNTASWTQRLALPTPGEVTSELVAWLSNPDMHNSPLRDVTQFVFTLITAPHLPASTVERGAYASASLCAWEGGEHGSYRVLA